MILSVVLRYVLRNTEAGTVPGKREVLSDRGEVSLVAWGRVL